MRKRLEIEDILEYKFLSALRAAPDGERCAFCVSRAGAEENRYWTDLFLYEEGRIRALTSHGLAGPAVWLGENTLLFPKPDAEARPEARTVYDTLDLETGEEAFHMEIPAAVTWISPLANGMFAVLIKSYLPDRALPADGDCGAQPCQDPDYIAADELPFRQDGLGITNGMRLRCCLFDPALGRLSPVSDPWQNIESICAEGNRIIFSPRRFEKNSKYLFYGGVEVYDAETGKRDVLLDDGTFRVYGVGFLNGMPVFAGTRGLLHGYQNENSSFYRFDGGDGPVLFCANDRSVHNTVGTDVRYGEAAPFLPMNGGVYYVGTENGGAPLKFAGLDGKIRTLSGGEGAAGSFAVLKDRILCAGLWDNRPEELYVIKDGRQTLVSGFNEKITLERTLSAPEAFRFASAGLELDGYAIKPVDFHPEKKYPAILYIHGGHKCAFGPVYYHEMQVWANRGFFVLFCNPRGSDGRDDVFADVIGHYGFWEEEDLLAFRTACLERYPQIDADRMGIGGGSYGGFLTNWMIGRTHCFRCAVSQRGIASWVSMFFTSDTGYLFPCWDFETDVWMDPERYWTHSPLKYAGACDTPTLFIHSEDDYRCPYSEGISMFHALQYRGIESRLCIFKGESHGLSRSGKPRSRIKRLTEITRWFEEHLA